MIYLPDYPSTSFQIESHLCDSLLLYIIITQLLLAVTHHPTVHFLLWGLKGAFVHHVDVSLEKEKKKKTVFWRFT